MRARQRGGILSEKLCGADTTDRINALADLIVRFGANVQPGQIVAIGSEPGKETLARAVAVSAYKAGAKFVDLSVFDIHVKRARVLYAAPRTRSGSCRPGTASGCARSASTAARAIALTGPVAPHIMDGVDPSLLGKDLLPAAARVDRDRQPPDHELDGGAMPDPGLGRARPPGAAAGRRARAALARRRLTCAASTRTTRWPPGRNEWDRLDGGRRQARRAARSTRSASRDRGPI